MSKQMKKKGPYDNISVSKIYETLKSKQFLQDLWWDLISDMKEKPSYKRIKGMVDALITKQTKDICAAPCDDKERLRRKNVVAEMSIMAYTIDTVISQILYTKLQNEFITIIRDTIEELKRENDAEQAAGVNSILNSTNNAGIKVDIRESDKNWKDVTTEKQNEDFSPLEDSDAESDISIAKLSVDSVSSVHTSELSSFDDEISISSDDEMFGKRKKRMSYKEANDRFLHGKLPVIRHTKRKNRPKSPKDDYSPKRLAKGSPDKADPISPEDFNRKTLPPRVRKPNSKYASESIFCPVRFSPSHLENSNLTSPIKTMTLKNESPLQLSKRRGRPRKPGTDGNDPQTSAKLEYLDDVAKDIAAVKGIKVSEVLSAGEGSSMKHSESSDLYKSSRRMIGSQAFKKSTAVTLFSTAMKDSASENS